MLISLLLQLHKFPFVAIGESKTCDNFLTLERTRSGERGGASKGIVRYCNDIFFAGACLAYIAGSQGAWGWEARETRSRSSRKEQGLSPFPVAFRVLQHRAPCITQTPVRRRAPDFFIKLHSSFGDLLERFGGAG